MPTTPVSLDMATALSIARYVGSDHLGRIDYPIEFRFRDVAELKRSSLQCQVVIHGVVGYLRRLIVADHGSERGHQHQRAIDIFLDLLQVRLRAFDQEPTEIRAAVAQDGDRMHEVEYHQRLVDSHPDVAAGPTHTDPHLRS